MNKETTTPENTGIDQGTRNPDGTFKQGVSGNPAGKPPGTKHLTTKLWEYLEKVAKDKDGNPDPEQKTYADKLVERIILETIARGNTSLIQMVYDRIDGKPDQGINMNVSGEVGTNSESVMEIARRVSEELKKKKT